MSCRVCHMSSAHQGLDIRIYRKECVSLAAAGYDTHLVINATQADVDEARLAGVKLHPLPVVDGSRRLSRMSLHAWRCYTLAKNLNADIYHLHDPELIPYGILLARAGKRVIFDSHEDLPAEIQTKDWIPAAARKGIASLAQFMESASASRFAAVVAATPHIGEIFEGAAKRVAVINNYPLLDELAPQDDSRPVERDSVCYIGGIERIRGIKEAIQAIGKTQSQLVLAGMFSSEALRAEVMQYAGWRRVRELGFISRKRVAEVLARSYSGLVTFYREPNSVNAQPNKMFEYMSAGVPVIASDFPLWRKVVEGNQCGLCVDESDPDAIAAAITYLQNNPQEVARMGSNGRKAVHRQYRWDCEKDKLLLLYDEILHA